MKFLQDVEILKNNIYHKGLQETKPYENNDQNDAIETNDPTPNMYSITMYNCSVCSSFIGVFCVQK